MKVYFNVGKKIWVSSLFLIIYKWDLVIPKITFSFKSRIQDTCNWALLPVGVAIDNTNVLKARPLHYSTAWRNTTAFQDTKALLQTSPIKGPMCIFKYLSAMGTIVVKYCLYPSRTTLSNLLASSIREESKGLRIGRDLICPSVFKSPFPGVRNIFTLLPSMHVCKYTHTYINRCVTCGT